VPEVISSKKVKCSRKQPWTVWGICNTRSRQDQDCKIGIRLSINYAKPASLHYLITWRKRKQAN